MFSSRKCLYIPHRRDFVYNPPPPHPSGKSNILLSFMHFFNVFWSYSSIPPPRKFHPFCRGERIFSGTEQYRVNYDQRTLGNANYNSNGRAHPHLSRYFESATFFSRFKNFPFHMLSDSLWVSYF